MLRTILAAVAVLPSIALAQATEPVQNRAPLRPQPFLKLPPGAIRPEGWLRGQLELMRDGMTGRLAELSPWVKFEGSAWASPDGQGENGWEELPYWLRGLGDLGYVLGDRPTIDQAKRWIDAIIASQREDGSFGPQANIDANDIWPNMLVLNALQSYHEWSGDPRIIPFMTRYFRWLLAMPEERLLPGSWQKVRAGDNLESVLWLYNRTGDADLIELAHRLHRRTIPWSEGIANWHGVNIAQGFREPGVYWLLSHEGAHLGAVSRNYDEVMRLYGQVPGGMFGADENCRKGFDDPRQAAETCTMAEFMHSFQMLTRMTGHIEWADRCEDVAFNSLPAAFLPDYKGLRYLTAPNMVSADRGNKAPGIQNAGEMYSFDASDYRCCQHNHAFAWPYFTQNLWYSTPDGGLAAALYAPCSVSAVVGGGVPVTMDVVTEYPFRETVTMRLTTPRDVTFELLLRIPAWASGASLTCNGQRMDSDIPAPQFYSLRRVWKSGDELTLTLPMRTRVRTWEAHGGAVSIDHGPLTYSLKIDEAINRYEGSDAWPALEYLPRSPWNYGLEIDPAKPEASLRFIASTGPVPAQPFTPRTSPTSFIAKARRIPEWTVDKNSLAHVLQDGPIRTTQPLEEVTLIPMGAARLRIAAFPRVSTSPDARPWVTPVFRHEGSWEHDDVNAPSDGIEPASSSDHSIPRFTWWDRRGTREWVTYTLPEAKTISECEVYWFDDTGRGRCRTPESWTVQYMDDHGGWQEAKLKGAPGVDKDRYNTARFEPVRTTRLRITVQLREGFSSGILEWKVISP